VREVLEAFKDPEIRQVILCWSAQSSKTMTMLVALCYCIDQDPGPALMVQSSQDAATSFVRNRFMPMVQDCPALARHITGDRHDFSACEQRLDNMTVNNQGAQSPGQLASRPIRFLMADEIDKWKSESKKEADALSLAMERVKSFRNHKIFMCSTPTLESGPIWQAYQGADRREYHVPCPHCGAVFVLKWKHIQWPKDATLEEIRLNTWLECPHCRGHITERDKAEMLERGAWVAQNPDTGVERASFHLSELYSPWTKWGDLSVKFLKAKQEAKTGSTGQLHNFINSSLAEPWREDEHVKKRDLNQIVSLCDERPEGQVPGEGRVLGLTAGIDTQDNGFWFSIRAWGEHLESWLIRAGFCPDFGALQAYVTESRYLDPEGNQYAVQAAFIDSQGHRTADVYDFCRGNPIFRPVKGEQRLAGSPWKVTVLDSVKRGDGKRYPIIGGLQLLRIDTNFYKDMIAGKMSVEPGKPGRFHLHENPGKDYLAQVASEFKNEKGLWVCPRHRANHLWDCETYNLAAADVLGLRFFNRSVNNEQVKQKKPKPKRKTSSRWW
jgi:phage terminase large subunit GpA-like protein